MKKISKSITIINIISLILALILMFNTVPLNMYSEYCFLYFKFIKIFVGLGAIVSSVIAFKNKNILIGILNIITLIFVANLMGMASHLLFTYLVSLIISIVNLVLLIKNSKDDKINVICIIAIIICTIIETICIIIPISYSNSNISSFEQALPKIQQLKEYKGKKKTDLEGFNVKVNGKKIRLEHKNIGKETIFADVNGNELFRLKILTKDGEYIAFINYILQTEKYGITNSQ